MIRITGSCQLILLLAIAVTAHAESWNDQSPCGLLESDRSLMREECTPKYSPPVVAVLGSSTAAGTGASLYETSWVNRLAIALRNRGITLANISQSGTTTSDSLARFQADVRSVMPDFVVLATSAANEGLSVDNGQILNAYVANTRALIRMTEEIGATPILITPYPRDTFPPALRPRLLSVARQFESEGLTVWDFWNTVDDGAGRWLSGLTVDGTHPNDAGHLALFESIPLGFFDYARALSRDLPPRQDFGSWIAAREDGAQAFISVSPATPAPSWSAAVWTKAGDEEQEKTLLQIEGLNARIRRVTNRFELLVNEDVVAVGEASERAGFQHICLTYKNLTGMMTLYVNGLVAGTAVNVDAQPARLFTLGASGERPGMQGDSVAQFLIYRTPLSAEDVADLAAGRVPSKSLEAHLPLAQSPVRRNQNAAPTVVKVTINGAWHWVPEGPRTTPIQ